MLRMQVSSANYEARAFGIRADMCIGEAKRLCPDLIVMPYQYDKYQTASEQAIFFSPFFPSPHCLQALHPPCLLAPRG